MRRALAILALVSAGCGDDGPTRPATTCQAVGMILRGAEVRDTKGLDDAIANLCRTDDWARAARDCFARNHAGEPERCLARLTDAQRAAYQVLRMSWHPTRDAFLGVEYKTGRSARGAEVISVVPGSPAEAAGLRAGDVIERYDGEKIDGGDKLGKLVRACEVGHVPILSISRDGETVLVRPSLVEIAPRYQR